MNALLLISVTLGNTFQGLSKKMYNKRASYPATYFFVTVSAISAAIFFALTSGKLDFNLAFLPYSVAFAIAYASAVIGSVIAIASGPLSLTSLIASFSLMLPTLYGLIFKNDPISIGLFPGLVLLIASLILINKREKGVKINVKWVISVSVAFLGNGFCTIFQNMQQVKFDGAYKNEFMIIALIIAAAISCFMMLLKECSIIKHQKISGYALGFTCGAMNGLVNLFVMILSGRMPVSLMFPIISGGDIVATYIISKVVYKEKLSKLQLIGFILGTLAVILLNIK